MGKKLKPKAEVVALLTELLNAAKSGELTDVFAVYRCSDESYDGSYYTDDLGDMLLQVRTEVFRAQMPVDVIETEVREH